MPEFLKTNLLGFYNWPTDKQEKPTNQTLTTPLDRNNGPQMLSLINGLMKIKGYTSEQQGQEIEMMIKTAPRAIQTEEQMMEWLIDD